MRVLGCAGSLCDIGVRRTTSQPHYILEFSHPCRKHDPQCPSTIKAPSHPPRVRPLSQDIHPAVLAILAKWLLASVGAIPININRAAGRPVEVDTPLKDHPGHSGPGAVRRAHFHTHSSPPHPPAHRFRPSPSISPACESLPLIPPMLEDPDPNLLHVTPAGAVIRCLCACHEYAPGAGARAGGWRAGRAAGCRGRCVAVVWPGRVVAGV